MNTPKPAVVDEAALDWEGWSDPGTLAGRSAARWKILITGERTASRGLVTGIAQLAPGAQLQPHHHEPEETYYIVSGQGEMEIDDDTTAVGPGCAIYIPANARHALRCTGSEPLFFVFAFARDRFDQIKYHFVQ
jgi:mannose-6-phosphate isomerase-like protein (cupin superfamily)